MKKIVLVEGADQRVIEAAKILVSEEVCHPVVLDAPVEAFSGLADNAYTVLNSGEEQALELGSSLVAQGKADGIVAGAVHTTAEVFRSYRTVIGIDETVARASSCFVMEKGDQKFIFADCAINIRPDAKTLAATARSSAAFAELIGLKPKIAFLSFVTRDSAQDQSSELIKEAILILKEQQPEIVVDGPVQADVALVPDVAKNKAADSPIQGDANILLFPDLMSGNIAYKLVERLGGYSATGPLLLGFKAPAHDLSRGCTTQDIVAVAKIAVTQAS